MIFGIRRDWRRIKIWISLLVIVSVLLPSVPVMATEAPKYEMPISCLEFRRLVGGDVAEITGYRPDNNDANKTLTIAGYYNYTDGVSGIWITKIDNSVFCDQTFTMIFIETGGGLVVGKHAFSNVKVQKVKGSAVAEYSVDFLGNSLREIQDYAFMQADVAGDFTIDTIDGSIGVGAFQDAKVGGKLTIKGNLDSIGQKAFDGFSSGELDLSCSIRRIEDRAFRGTNWKKFTISDSTEYLGSELFADSDLQTLYLPQSDTVNVAEDDAFPNKEDLTIVIPIGVTDLAVYHFDEYPNVLFQVAEEISQNSPVLEYLNKYHLKYQIGEHGEIINAGATSTETPEATPTVTPEATPETTPEATPTVTPETTPEITDLPTATPPIEDKPTPTPTDTSTIAPPIESEPPTPTPTDDASEQPPKDSAAPAGSVTSTPGPTVSAATPTPVSTGGQSQTDHIFTGKEIKYRITGKNQVSVTGTFNKKITKLTIPDMVRYQDRLYKVTAVDKKAFRNMAKLKKVVIGNYVKTVGDQAFCKCKNLQSISFGNGTVKLGRQVLYQNKKLKRIIFKGKKLKKIGKKSFAGVSKSVKITAPKSMAKAYRKMIKKAV